MTDDMTQLSEAIRELTGAYRNEIAEDIDRRRLIEAEQEKVSAAQAKTKAQYDAATTAVAGLVASFGVLGKTLVSTEAGMSKYNSAINSGSKSIQGLLLELGPLGKAAATLTKIFTLGIGAVLELNDAMLKGTDELASFGAAGAFSAKEVLLMGQNAGYSSGILSKWTGIVKSLGTDIIGLSGTVSGGVKVFADMTDITQDQLDKYQALGVSQEQLNENQAAYIKLQISSGLQITDRMKQDGSLKKASIEYTNVLLELSALTGLDIESAKKTQEAAVSDLAVKTRLAGMQDKMLDLQNRAVEATDQATKKKLEAEAAEIKTSMDSTVKLLAFAKTMMSAQDFVGMQFMTASGNFNEVSSGFAAGVPGILEFIAGVQNGSRKAEEFGKFMADATTNTRLSLGENIILQQDLGKALAYSTEALTNEAKFKGKTSKEIADIQEKDLKEIQKILKDGSKDSVQNARSAQLSLEKEIRKNLDNAVLMISGPVTDVFTNLANLINGAVKNSFENLVTVMRTTLGGIARYSDKFFGTDLARIFETQEEMAARVESTVIALSDNENKIKALKNITLMPESASGLADEAKAEAKKELVEKQKNARDMSLLVDKDIELIKEKIQNAKVIDYDVKKNEFLLKQKLANEKVLAEAVDKETDLSKKKILMSKREVAEREIISTNTQQNMLLEKQRIAHNEKLEAEAKKKLNFDKLENANKDIENAKQKLIVANRIAWAAAENADKENQQENAIKLRDLEKKRVELENTLGVEEARLLTKKLETGAKLNEKELAQLKKRQAIADDEISFQKKLLEDRKNYEKDKLLLEKEKSEVPLEEEEKTRLKEIKQKRAIEDKEVATAAAGVTKGQGPLSDLVAKGESLSTGNYNAANRSIGNKEYKAYKAGEKNLESMTIGEVTAEQKAGKIHAAGRYQIIPTTMQDAIKALGLKESDKFDAKTQDKIFKEYLLSEKKRGSAYKFLEGKKDANLDAAILDLAKEFASIGVPNAMTVDDNWGKRSLKKGDSYYAGIPGNPKDKAPISPDEVAKALILEQQIRTNTKEKLATEPTKPESKSQKNLPESDSLQNKAVDKKVSSKPITAGESKTPSDTEPLLQASRGGIFSGPMSGYPVELHGDEIVAPMELLKGIIKQELPSLETTGINPTSAGFQLPELSSIFEDFKKKFEQLSSAPVETVSSVQAPTTASSDNSINDFKQMTTEMIMVLTDKLDTVISKLGDGNDAREKILTYSMA